MTAKDADSEVSRAALEELCQTYWRPLYVYLRRKGNAVEKAEDLTQGFFVNLFEKDFLRVVKQERGKFRTFLLVSLNRYVADEHSKEQAQKRNVGRNPVSLDIPNAEDWYRALNRNTFSPEREFERNWAMSTMRNALDDVEAYYEGRGDLRKFAMLSPYITAGAITLPYAAIAQKLGTSEGAVKVAIHRLRKRYRDALREQVAQTISDDEDLDEELRCLMNVFSK